MIKEEWLIYFFSLYPAAVWECPRRCCCWCHGWQRAWRSCFPWAWTWNEKAMSWAAAAQNHGNNSVAVWFSLSSCRCSSPNPFRGRDLQLARACLNLTEWDGFRCDGQFINQIFVLRWRSSSSDDFWLAIEDISCGMKDTICDMKFCLGDLLVPWCYGPCLRNNA